MSTYLRRLRYHPRERSLETTDKMSTGEDFPPVPVSAAWTIRTSDGIIGYLLKTRWGYRASRSLWSAWDGCWHTSRDWCRDWYANDYRKRQGAV